MKRVQINEDNLLRYGVSNQLASKAAGNGLTITKIKTLSISEIESLFSMTDAEARELKTCVIREPIDKNIASQLLSASNFTCSLCKGVKSHAYIIHHITPHAQTQDNSYNNLIVLCPSDHDLAHRPGALTLGIPKDQLISQKLAWEAEVRMLNTQAATRDVNFTVSENTHLNREDDVKTLQYLMYFIPFTSLLSHTYHLPNSFNLDFLDVATHMETLRLDRPHGYPFTDPLLQAAYGDYLEKYNTLYHLINGETRGISHFLSADDVRGIFTARRNQTGLTYDENQNIYQELSIARDQFAASYTDLILFLRNNYPEVALDAYNTYNKT